MTETELVRALQAHANMHSARWFRNNVAQLKAADGRYVRCGLCVGSSDIIGWTPYEVQPGDVGRTLAVFTAFECKVGRNTTTVEQGAFLATVRAQGGIAAVVRRLADADAAVSGF